MPTYDYECQGCGHTLEIFQGINDPHARKCPECGKNRLKRQFGTGAGILFKGSGFYQTDYRSESYKKAAAKDKKSSEPKTEKTEKKESKSEPKSNGTAAKSTSS